MPISERLTVEGAASRSLETTYSPIQAITLNGGVVVPALKVIPTEATRGALTVNTYPLESGKMPTKTKELPPINSGDVFEFAYPFVRDTYFEMDQDGTVEAPTWKPGVRFVERGPEDSEAVADGIGAQIVTVIGTYKPGKYPTRVFFTRSWRDPGGKVFGKPSLRVLAVAPFRGLVAGYRYEVRVMSAAELASQTAEVSRES